MCVCHDVINRNFLEFGTREKKITLKFRWKVFEFSFWLTHSCALSSKQMIIYCSRGFSILIKIAAFSFVMPPTKISFCILFRPTPPPPFLPVCMPIFQTKQKMYNEDGRTENEHFANLNPSFSMQRKLSFILLMKLKLQHVQYTLTHTHTRSHTHLVKWWRSFIGFFYFFFFLLSSSGVLCIFELIGSWVFPSFAVFIHIYFKLYIFYMYHFLYLCTCCFLWLTVKQVVKIVLQFFVLFYWRLEQINFIYSDDGIHWLGTWWTLEGIRMWLCTRKIESEHLVNVE